ncbi:MAG: RNA polymerase sigma factor [Planctomycetota bacterium]
MPAREAQPDSPGPDPTRPVPGRATDNAPGDPILSSSASGDLTPRNTELPVPLEQPIDASLEAAARPRATDPTVIAAARAGDEDALRRLLAPEPDRLYAVCLGMLRDPDAARDAAQDALVRIIRGLETYDGRARFTTWTTRIALNVCLTRLRQSARRAGLDRRFAVSSRPIGGEPEAGSRVEETERARRAADTLSQLSEEHRTVLVLRDVRGLDLDRISEALGLPIGTIKSRLFRARIALRTLLEQHDTS